MADLEGENKKLTVAELRYIHERKTSALLCCSVRLGGMSANCTPAQLKALTDFGYNVGLAFQVIDDILDSGKTLKTVSELVMDQGAASVKTCVLLWKKLDKEPAIRADKNGRSVGVQPLAGC